MKNSAPQAGARSCPPLWEGGACFGHGLKRYDLRSRALVATHGASRARSSCWIVTGLPADPRFN